MKLLLDTHIFLWMGQAPHKLTDTMRDALLDPNNVLFLSVVSVWEMQIKAQIGKLDFPLPIRQFVAIQRAVNQVHTLPVVEAHIWTLGALPLFHKDPFDRLLIAQGIAEDCHLMTVDAVFGQYPVQCFN